MSHDSAPALTAVNSSRAPKSRFRWYQVSLRALFGLMTVVALFFSWIGYQYREGQRTKAVVEELGGSVQIWHYLDHRWGRVISISLSRTAVGDKELARVVELPYFSALYLDDTAITDKGLAQVLKVRNLRILDISDTNISDAGLEQLTGAHNLVFLQAHHTGITDEGVAKLQQALPELKVYYSAP